MTPDEQRLINEAAVAVRKAANCPSLRPGARAVLRSTVGLLETWEDQSVPDARSLRIVAEPAPQEVGA
jgi:hypothetical protein